jgi:hypothetical protein
VTLAITILTRTLPEWPEACQPRARTGRKSEEPHTQFWALPGLALLFAFLGLAWIAAALFPAAAAGLLLPPVRAYAGLVRR